MMEPSMVSASTGTAACCAGSTLEPSVADQACGNCAPPLPQGIASSTDLRILIVEDDPDNAEALRSLLQACGHTVHVVGDAETAIAHGRALGLDVVLCDLDLPGPLDGLDVARTLRMLAPRPRLIAYSGYGQPQDLARSRDAGFDDHIVKPAALARIVEACSGHADPPRPA